MCCGKINQHITAKIAQLLVMSEGKVKTFSDIQWRDFSVTALLKERLRDILQQEEKWTQSKMWDTRINGVHTIYW